MEDFMGVVVVILYFVIACVASKNKKKKKTANSRKKRRAAMEGAFAQMESEHAPIPQPEQMALDLAQEGDDPCHSEMLAAERPAMRPMNVSPEALDLAQEGEDPCHIGSALETEDLLEDSPADFAEDQNTFAQDILRGVIMSEILTRPTTRRSLPRMKRGA